MRFVRLFPLILLSCLVASVPRALAQPAAAPEGAQLIPTSIEVGSGADTVNFADPVTLTATVSPTTATGLVQFNDGATMLGIVGLSHGQASVDVFDFSIGTHRITAIFGGNATYARSESPVFNLVVVAGAFTRTTLTSAPNPSALGTTVTMVATVTPSYATGSIQFLADAAPVATVPVVSGTAACSTAALTVGIHSLQAILLPGPGYSASTSQTLSQMVTPMQTATSLVANRDTTVFGDSVTFTATVTPDGATGVVWFMDGGSLLASKSLSGGVAVLSTAALAVGTRTITAEYKGDATHSMSTSAPLRHMVMFAPTTTVLGSVPNPSVYGQSVSLTATVTPSAATGLMRFYRGGLLLGTAALSGGVGVLNTSGLPVGPDTIVAIYGGDIGRTGSSSAPRLHIVNRAGTGITLASSANPSGVGQPVNFTAQVTATSPGVGTPTGTVHLRLGGVEFASTALVAGTATVSLDCASVGAALPVGLDSVTAVYDGDASFIGCASTVLEQSVVPPKSSPTFQLKWGSPGTGPGQFGPATGDIRGVAIDASGYVYVADPGNDRIQKFDSRGNFVTAWGSTGSGKGQFHNPVDVAVDATGYVYVVDRDNYRVQKFTGGGIYVAKWGSFGTSGGQFGAAMGGIATDGAGNVYVADGGNYRVQRFSSSGGLMGMWGGAGTGNGRFSGPLSGIATFAASFVYVADPGARRISKFDVEGNFIAAWSVLGEGTGECSRIPRMLGVDVEGDVYVTSIAELGAREVRRLGPDGTALGSWGEPGSGAGQFGNPSGVAVDAFGNVFVVDQQLARIQKFEPANTVQRISRVEDVRNDEGRQVRVTFTAHFADRPGAPVPIVRYEIFRRIDPRFRPGRVTAPRGAGPLAVQLAGWDAVATVGAYTDSIYSAVVPTLADSNGAGTHSAVFLVRAATATPSLYFDSAPDSGHSVDNLPPAVPAPFTGDLVGGVAHLHWGPSPARDFAQFRLYRGRNADFTPAPGNLRATLADTGFADPADSGSVYKLTAVDGSGNESAPAMVRFDNVTTAPGAGIPRILWLGRIAPNPARRSARIEFSLPVAARVTLNVMDVGGRIVRRLIAERRDAGAHVENWDLADAAGKPVGSGVYFLRLEAGGGMLTRRVAVVR
ncbi:MAG: Ig-like domain repeat protein [Candidatus Eisenbacteria bacterium]|nr:Ig-like domain repeat protein [Candidatus Eisenbacteria bacterium]